VADPGISEREGTVEGRGLGAALKPPGKIMNMIISNQAGALNPPLGIYLRNVIIQKLLYELT
jgi:hypothetical protein